MESTDNGKRGNAVCLLKGVQWALASAWRPWAILLIWPGTWGPDSSCSNPSTGGVEGCRCLRTYAAAGTQGTPSTNSLLRPSAGGGLTAPWGRLPWKPCISLLAWPICQCNAPSMASSQSYLWLGAPVAAPISHLEVHGLPSPGLPGLPSSFEAGPQPQLGCHGAQVC